MLPPLIAAGDGGDAPTLIFVVTEIIGYSDTGYSDTQLTVTFLVNPMLKKGVTVRKYLPTVTLFPCPEDVILTEGVCTESCKSLPPSLFRPFVTQK